MPASLLEGSIGGSPHSCFAGGAVAPGAEASNRTCWLRSRCAAAASSERLAAESIPRLGSSPGGASTNDSATVGASALDPFLLSMNSVLPFLVKTRSQPRMARGAVISTESSESVMRAVPLTFDDDEEASAAAASPRSFASSDAVADATNGRLVGRSGRSVRGVSRS